MVFKKLSERAFEVKMARLEKEKEKQLRKLQRQRMIAAKRQELKEQYEAIDEIKETISKTRRYQARPKYKKFKKTVQKIGDVAYGTYKAFEPVVVGATQKPKKKSKKRDKKDNYYNPFDMI